MDDFEQKVTDVVNNVLDENSATNQFALSQTPYHTHNGADSQKVDFKDLQNRNEFLNINLMGFQGQTSNNWGVIFTAPYACNIIGATEVHQTAESTSTTMTVQIEKLTGTQASGSGTSLLLNPFNLKAAANTIQTGILNTTSVKTSKNVFNFQIGDRIGLVLTTTGSASNTLVGVNIIIRLQY